MGRNAYFLLVLLSCVLLQSTQSLPQTPPPSLLQANSSESASALAQENPANSSSQISPPRGSNFAEYNEACSPPDTFGKICNPSKDYICENQICKCKMNTVNPELPLVFGTSSSNCVTVASAKTNWYCTDDSQCTNTRYGRYSRCNTTTGNGVGQCECHDTDGMRREVAFVDSVCYPKKELGESCQNDMECNATIVGEAVCIGSGTGKLGVCSCADKHQFEPNFKECLKLGTQNSPCKSDFQCKHVEALGPLSRCTPAGVCDCWHEASHGQTITKFHEGRCHISRGVNETCNEKLECQLGYHQNADCLAHDSYNGEKVCQCPPGADCKNSGSVSSASLTITIGGLCSYMYYYSINHC